MRRKNFGDSVINKGYLRIFTAHARNNHISASDLKTFSVNFFHQKTTCPPYFYFRFIWPTNLESVPPFEPPTLIIAKFKVDMTIHPELQRCWCGYVTWPCDLVLWPFNLGQLSNSAGTWATPPRSLNILRLSVIDLWVMMYAIGYR